MRRALELLAFGLALHAAPAWSLDCGTRPELCGRPVTSEISEPHSAIAQDVVFLGDGFTSSVDDQLAFRDATQSYVEALKADPAGQELVGRDPTLFNFHRVDVESPTAELGDADPANTAFGARAVTGELITYDAAAVAFAAAQNAPDVDTIVLIVNASAGRATASLPTSHTSGGRVAIPPGQAATLRHELGHALFGLADEYAVYTGCFQGSEGGLATFANLTTSAAGEKFSRAGVPAPIEGAHWWASCIYRPASTCLMRHASAAWCPVCAYQAQLQLEERRRQTDLQAPFPGFDAPVPLAQLSGEAMIRARASDGFGVTRLELWIDGELRATSPDGLLSFGWFTPAAPDGPHTLELRAQDAAGHESTASMRVFVDNPPDELAPTLSFVAPAADALVNGVVLVELSASDDVGIAELGLFVDEVWIGNELTHEWDSTLWEDGVHRLTARATDWAGNLTITDALEVTVLNARPNMELPSVIPPAAPDAGAPSPSPPAPPAQSCSSPATAGPSSAVLFLVTLLGALAAGRSRC